MYEQCLLVLHWQWMITLDVIRPFQKKQCIMLLLLSDLISRA
uniref:Uncharacterized protein n=1 Tax=Anguilla anguilla TaxID=7936 RepID=A0A0E9S1H5_ANGAN